MRGGKGFRTEYGLLAEISMLLILVEFYGFRHRGERHHYEAMANLLWMSNFIFAGAIVTGRGQLRHFGIFIYA